MKKIKDIEVVVKGNKMFCKKYSGRIFRCEYGGRKEGYSDCTCDAKK